jgi:cytidylate kinase
VKVIALIGESCVGKSTLAAALKDRLGAKVYAGKDYLRLAKDEAAARLAFAALLRDATEPLVYVVSEKDQVDLLPEVCARVLMTAPIEVIKERFAARTGGKLPPAVAAMLEKKHGAFDDAKHDILLQCGAYETDEACARIAALLG